jgi:hypothetical protein
MVGPPIPGVPEITRYETEADELIATHLQAYWDMQKAKSTDQETIKSEDDAIEGVEQTRTLVRNYTASLRAALDGQTLLTKEFLVADEECILLENHLLQQNTRHPAVPDTPTQTCTLACIRNSMLALGTPRESIPSENQLIAKIDADHINENGIEASISDDNEELVIADKYLIQLLGNLGFIVTPTRNFITLLYALRSGNPVVLSQNSFRRNSHLVLCTGYRYTDDKVLEIRISDPRTQEPYYKKAREVAWDALDPEYYKAFIIELKD